MELDDLLNDLALGPSKPAAPAPASVAPKAAPAKQPVASSDLDDLLNDLDAPPPRAKPQPAKVGVEPKKYLFFSKYLWLFSSPLLLWPLLHPSLRHPSLLLMLPSR